VPSPADLDRIQRLFWELITAPTGAGAGAEDLAVAGLLESTDLSFLVRGDERLGPVERLDIYADMYFYRLRDSLAEDFPKVAAVLGGDRFHNLVTDYLLAHPSSHWSLRNLGEALPAYLEGHAPSSSRPFLADLARLEWARIDVFDEENAATLRREDLSGMPPEIIADLRLHLVPACRILRAAWNVASVWRRVEEFEGAGERGGIHSASIETAGENSSANPLEIAPPEPGSFFLRIWRQDLAVYHRGIREDEHAALQEMERGGLGLARLGEIVFERTDDPDDDPGSAERTAAAARRVAAMMESWIEEGIVRALPASPA